MAIYCESPETTKIWSIENVWENRECGLWGILALFCFREFRGKEFFNSHAILQQ
jgi:hypothetical protein